MRALVSIIGLMFWVMKDDVEQPEVNNMDVELEKMYQMWCEQQTQNPEPPADDGSSFIPENALLLSIFLLLPLLSYVKWSNRSKIQTPDLGFDAEDCIKMNKDPEIIRSNQWKRLLKIRRKSPNMKPRWSKRLFAFCSMKCVVTSVYILRHCREMTEHALRAVNKPEKQNHPVKARKRNYKPKTDFKKLVKNLFCCKKKKWHSKKKDASHEIGPTLCPRPSASSESIKCAPAMKTHAFEPVCRSFMFSEQQSPLENHIKIKHFEIQYRWFPKIFIDSRRMYEQSLVNSSASKEDFVPPASPAKETHTYEPVCRRFMLTEHLENHIRIQRFEIQYEMFPQMFVNSQKMYEQSLSNSSASKEDFVPPVSPAKITYTYKLACRRFMLTEQQFFLENHLIIKRIDMQFGAIPKIFIDSRRMYEESLLNSSASTEDLYPSAIRTSKPHYCWKWLHAEGFLSRSPGRVDEEDWKEKFKAYLDEMKEHMRSMRYYAVTKFCRICDSNQ